jgi:hypothetical protein
MPRLSPEQQEQGLNLKVSARIPLACRGRRGHDRMVVGFTITYAINAYHH